MGSEEDIISIMITTDSHLGYCERDPVRMNDSFAAFEEVLKLSRENRVDMMLLGGDLFHDNKPSRRTMRNAVQLLEKYVLGDDPINFEIISDQKKIFGQDCNQVNYLHPHMSIALPIFSIHGNHDDPSRDGGPEALAALDLLSATRLINYFGCQDKVDDIHIKPILIKKGQTRIALYGLGNVRDERLNRSWDQNKVTFYRPAQDEASDIHLENHDDNLDTHHLKEPCARFFNILLLHQNRATMRAGVKTSIEERMIPKWMDLVIWGHEHECRIDFERSSQGRFAITQPGSTVATSLSPGEAIKKNCAIIQIKLDRIKMQTFPMTMIRTFIHDEFILANDEDLAESRDRGEIIDETNIVQVLQNKVESMVTQAKDNISIPRFSDQLFQLLQPELALIRLRVDHRGFPKVNAKNLGASFVQKLANPEQVLLFSRSSTTKKNNKRDDTNTINEDDDLPYQEDLDIDEEDELGENQLAALVKGRLLNSTKRLSVLDETQMLDALHDYVVKMEAKAFEEVVEKQLEDSKEYLKNTAPEEDDEIEASLAHLKATNQAKAQKKKPPKKKTSSKHIHDDDEEDDEEDDDDVPIPPVKSKKRKAPTATTKKKKTVPDSDDENDDEDDDIPKKSKRRKAAVLDSDDDIEIQEKKTTKRGIAAARPRRTARAKQSYVEPAETIDESEESDDNEVVIQAKRTASKKRSRNDDDDEEYDDFEIERPKAKKKPAARKPAAKRIPDFDLTQDESE